MVGLQIENDFYSIGAGDFFVSFFDNIHFHLEKDKEWGSEYPILLNEFYKNGKVQFADLDKISDELKQVKYEFAQILPDKVIWDINDLNKRPPWGDNISDDITDLSNYFVTSDGKDLFEVLFTAAEAAKLSQSDITIT
jgi:2,3-bisphosphoglycerate-dependent phosphoglycerate mutase